MTLLINCNIVFMWFFISMNPLIPSNLANLLSHNVGLNPAWIRSWKRHQISFHNACKRRVVLFSCHNWCTWRVSHLHESFHAIDLRFLFSKKAHEGFFTCVYILMSRIQISCHNWCIQMVSLLHASFLAIDIRFLSTMPANVGLFHSLATIGAHEGSLTCMNPVVQWTSDFFP